MRTVDQLLQDYAEEHVSAYGFSPFNWPRGMSAHDYVRDWEEWADRKYHGTPTEFMRDLCALAHDSWGNLDCEERDQFSIEAGDALEVYSAIEHASLTEYSAITHLLRRWLLFSEQAAGAA